MDAIGVDSTRWTTMEGIISSFSEAVIYDLIRSMTQINQSLSIICKRVRYQDIISAGQINDILL